MCTYLYKSRNCYDSLSYGGVHFRVTCKVQIMYFVCLSFPFYRFAWVLDVVVIICKRLRSVTENKINYLSEENRTPLERKVQQFNVDVKYLVWSIFLLPVNFETTYCEWKTHEEEGKFHVNEGQKNNFSFDSIFMYTKLKCIFDII